MLWLPNRSAISVMKFGCRGSRIDHDLLDSQLEYSFDLRQGGDAAAEGDRHKCFAGDLAQQFLLALLSRLVCGDVEQNELVDALVVEDAHGIDRIADVRGLLELHRLDEIAVAKQEDGHHANPCHPTVSRSALLSSLAEISEKPHSENVAFLRVKLHAHHILRRDCCSEFVAVMCDPNGERRVVALECDTNARSRISARSRPFRARRETERLSHHSSPCAESRVCLYARVGSNLTETASTQPSPASPPSSLDFVSS